MKWYKVFISTEEAMGRIPERSTVLVKIGQHRLCLARFNNILYAMADACPHNGAQLSEGNINHIGEIICPWHNYRFRMQDGKGSESNCGDLWTYPVDSRIDGIYVGINSN